MPFNKTPDGVAAQRPTLRPREQWIDGGTLMFVEPGTKHGALLPAKRRDPFLASLAVAADVAAAAELDRTAGEAGELAHAKPSLECEQQQRRVVPSPEPTRAVGRSQQSCHLLLGEVGDKGLVALLRTGEHPPDQPGMLGAGDKRRSGTTT